MAAWPPRFLFVSGRLCLDFAHTGREGRYAKFERLRGPQDLADWLAECSLRLKGRTVRHSDLRTALELRRAIWRAAQSVLRGRSPSRGVVSTLNAAAARPDLTPVLRRGRACWAESATAGQALSAIARDAVALFGGDLRSRIRECRHPRCTLLFVDLSRPGKRAWCAMRRCGNLVKTSSYRRRTKSAARGKRGRRVP